ncbi:hypothetical protein LZ318_05315 [Saccharopolyspora indica]|uniref:ABC transporter substrate-binding protein n=1 Tax=Saccharopolyspora indica TaxID=1229659 RepID=UPI0022EAB10E|nr:hypothetical protein [Saccharopolyspora indica]MDA3648472.1 hypothetical protein [Saccharopolyspora indica]
MANYVDRSWWRKHRLKVLAVACVVALVAGATAYVMWRSGRCADGIVRVEGGECVGMTDGSYSFDEEDDRLRSVMEKIKAENDRVLQTGDPYVSIAYFAPMTLAAETDTVTAVSTKNSLQGAHLAQLRANSTREVDGSLPLIRLLPANPGSRAEHWEPVVRQIVEAQETERLVAVAGLGQSHDTTAAAIGELAEHGIPMVGATITADSFTEAEKRGEFIGLMRVAPSNSDQIKAIVQRLQDTQRAMLVQDINQSDLLADDLAKAFNSEYPENGRQLTPTENYDSSRGTANTFPSMVRNICISRPDAIFFSGRYHDLTLLMEALQGRPCEDLELRVLTLDSVVEIAGVEEVRKSLAPNTSLEYTHLSSPLAWRVKPEAFDAGAVRYFDANYGKTFPDDRNAGDGMAITSYDAMAVAITGARRAASGPEAGALVTANSVAEQFLQMKGANAVAGASGWLSFETSDSGGTGDRHRGHPEAKAFSVFTFSAGDRRPTEDILPEVVSATGQVFTYPR